MRGQPVQHSLLSAKGLAELVGVRRGTAHSPEVLDVCFGLGQALALCSVCCTTCFDWRSLRPARLSRRPRGGQGLENNETGNLIGSPVGLVFSCGPSEARNIPGTGRRMIDVTRQYTKSARECLDCGQAHLLDMIPNCSTVNPLCKAYFTNVVNSSTRPVQMRCSVQTPPSTTQGNTWINWGCLRG